MDDMDRAQHQEELFRADAIERAASMARQALGHHPTSTQCVECGQPIEAVRQVYGFNCCAGCAQEREYYALHGRTYR